MEEPRQHAGDRKRDRRREPGRHALREPEASRGVLGQRAQPIVPPAERPEEAAEARDLPPDHRHQRREEPAARTLEAPGQALRRDQRERRRAGHPGHDRRQRAGTISNSACATERAARCGVARITACGSTFRKALTKLPMPAKIATGQPITVSKVERDGRLAPGHDMRVVRTRRGNRPAGPAARAVPRAPRDIPAAPIG